MLLLLIFSWFYSIKFNFVPFTKQIQLWMIFHKNIFSVFNCSNTVTLLN